MNLLPGEFIGKLHAKEQDKFENRMTSITITQELLENMFKTYRTHRNIGEIDYLFREIRK